MLRDVSVMMYVFRVWYFLSRGGHVIVPRACREMG